MAKKRISPKDNAANTQNSNKGTSGNNQQYLQAKENTRRQIENAKTSKNSEK